jgi:hypothetical protein
MTDEHKMRIRALRLERHAHWTRASELSDEIQRLYGEAHQVFLAKLIDASPEE